MFFQVESAFVRISGLSRFSTIVFPGSTGYAASDTKVGSCDLKTVFHPVF
jgi:hypothetical protein